MARTSPGPSVLKPMELPAFDYHSIDTPCPAGLRLDFVHEGKSRGLVRNGDIGADEIALGQEAERLGQFLGMDMQPGVGRADAGGRSAALCICGEREWATGSPNTERRMGGASAGGDGGPVAEIGQGIDVLGHVTFSSLPD